MGSQSRKSFLQDSWRLLTPGTESGKRAGRRSHMLREEWNSQWDQG